MARGRRVTEEEKRAIIALHREGVVLKEIAALFGVSESAISVIARNAGERRYDFVPRNRISLQDIKAILARFYAGEMVSKIAADYGITHGSVYYYARAHGEHGTKRIPRGRTKISDYIREKYAVARLD